MKKIIVLFCFLLILVGCVQQQAKSADLQKCFEECDVIGKPYDKQFIPVCRQSCITAVNYEYSKNQVAEKEKLEPSFEKLPSSFAEPFFEEIKIGMSVIYFDQKRTNSIFRSADEVSGSEVLLQVPGDPYHIKLYFSSNYFYVDENRTSKISGPGLTTVFPSDAKIIKKELYKNSELVKSVE